MSFNDSFIFHLSGESPLFNGLTVVFLSEVGALFVADGLPRPSLVGYVPLFALIVGRLIILPACCLVLLIPIVGFTWDEAKGIFTYIYTPGI